MGYAVYFEKGSVYRLPVNPETVTRKRKQTVETYRVLNGSQISLSAGAELEEISFEAEFPHSETHYSNSEFRDADFWEKKLMVWQKERAPVRFIASNDIGNDINLEVLVLQADITEKAGEEGDKYISLSLLEYQAPQRKYVAVAQTSAAAVVTETASQRPPENPAVTENKTYTVRSGDTLWAIARKFYGNGAEYTKIASANGISNPNLIYPGQVFSIP